MLKIGPIPEHVGFIMDGNRRFAREKSMKTIEGHSQGFNKLAEVLQWCQDLSVKQVTVYAFSLENFKRSEQEVKDLMELAREKFTQILKEKHRLNKHGVCIRFVGDIKRLPQDLQNIVEELQKQTEKNYKCHLNVCVAYTARHEMVEGINCLVKGVKDNKILASDINEHLFEQVLKVPKVDLLIRTSGEIRLSDFLLWQSSFSLLSFVGSLWPDLSVWQFYVAILDYQKAFKSIKNFEKSNSVIANGLSSQSQDFRVKQFLNSVKHQQH